MFVGPPGGDGLGSPDVELIGTEPGGVWASDHFGVLAVLRSGSGCLQATARATSIYGESSWAKIFGAAL